MKKQLLFTFLFICSLGFSQGVVTGKIMGSNSNDPLSGANILQTGTTNGTIADFDGNFTLNVNTNSGSIEISYLGFVKTRASFTLTNGTATLGTISLAADADALDEVVIIGKGIIDLATDRQTPVAVSTITAAQIQSKAAGNVEFGEAMKNTPSVYVSNQAGGFGDSQIFLRGFDQTNTAYLLNGQPINGMEDGRMYWSNWSGMSDVASAIQIQRGLGSSKLAISSVGGTVNIVSKTTDSREGGFVRFLAGNDSYFKGTASYNTGLSEKGWAFSFLLDHWQGHRKYSEGTAGQGQNYLFSVGYKPNDKHAFNLLITGAPQWHEQNFSNSLETYELRGEKYNGNSGFLDGERKSERTNYYHKPVANLNWDFNISENVDLSTVLYASWGRGGGTGPFGRGSRVRDENGLIDWAAIINNNIESAGSGLIGNFSDSRILRSSVNNHDWYGMLSNLSYEINDWSLNIGVDGRTYTGGHWRQINDFLGLNGFSDHDRILNTAYEAKPWKSLFDFAGEEDRIDYDYSETINYVGGFGQIEYASNGFSVFAQGAVSTQSYEREGRFPSATDGLGKSDKISKFGYNIKGGLGYTFNESHSIFANAGFYSRQPYLDNIFVDIRSSNELISPEIDNEEITGLEGGYRFKNNNLRLNVDVYWTEWGNRFITRGFQDSSDPLNPIFYTDRFTGISQVHKGFEYDLEYRPDYGNWRIRTFGSIGNWEYDGKSPFSRQNDDTGAFVITNGEVDLSGTKIGNAPQTSFGFGGSVDIIANKLSLDADYNIYTDLYGQVNPLNVINASESGQIYQAEILPAYTLADVGVTYKFNFGDNRFVFRGNLYNAFNEAYINQADAFGVFLGVGRTYNASLRYNF